MTVDTSKPHIGRIYDFMLGGHHNYEVDRQAAARILELVPTYPKWARANRWFLQLVAETWRQRGVERVLDIATGLPTEGHFNDSLPDARILFTDNDDVSVAYGQTLIEGRQNMAYRRADVGEPHTLIQRASEFFADDRVVAIGAIGIVYLAPDEVVGPLLAALHAWAAPGSELAITYANKVEGANIDPAIEVFQKQAGVKAFTRTDEEMAALAGPWRLREVKPLTVWLDVPDMFTEEELNFAYMSGAFFER